MHEYLRFAGSSSGFEETAGVWVRWWPVGASRERLSGIPGVKKHMWTRSTRRVMDAATGASTPPPAKPGEVAGTRVLYSESQRVPLSWWLAAVGVVAIIAWQAQMGRDWWWLLVAGVIAAALATWGLFALSRTKIEVFENSQGERIIRAGDAQLPASVVDRTLV